VDVERVRADFAGEDIARRFFAPAEVDALAASAPGEYVAAFFRCWTRKEAYVKARGDGLSLPLDRFEVPLEPAATRAIASCLDDPSGARAGVSGDRARPRLPARSWWRAMAGRPSLCVRRARLCEVGAVYGGARWLQIPHGGSP
jgi:hypothetical protein